MEEQNKVQETEVKKSPAAKMIFKFILGAAFVIVGAILLIRWWDKLLIIIKGCFGLFLILAGVITIAIAKE